MAPCDLITMGRSSIDLYSQDIGAPFPEIQGFAAYVGGCPTNIAVGVRRLGMKKRERQGGPATALLPEPAIMHTPK